MPIKCKGVSVMKGLAIAGMVLGIIALVFSFFPIVSFVSIVLAIISLIMTGVARSNLTPMNGYGMASAGMVMSILALVFSVLVNIACYGFLADHYGLFRPYLRYIPYNPYFPFGW